MLELLGSFSLDLERAVRLASVAHRDQVRKGSGIPYIQHPMAVAMILDRSGFAEPVVDRRPAPRRRRGHRRHPRTGPGGIRGRGCVAGRLLLGGEARRGRPETTLDRPQARSPPGGRRGRRTRPGRSSWPTSCTTSSASSSTSAKAETSGRSSTPGAIRSSGTTGRCWTPVSRATPGSRGWPRNVRRCSKRSLHRARRVVRQREN